MCLYQSARYPGGFSPAYRVRKDFSDFLVCPIHRHSRKALRKSTRLGLSRHLTCHDLNISNHQNLTSNVPSISFWCSYPSGLWSHVTAFRKHVLTCKWIRSSNSMLRVCDTPSWSERLLQIAIEYLCGLGGCSLVLLYVACLDLSWHLF